MAQINSSDLQAERELAQMMRDANTHQDYLDRVHAELAEKHKPYKDKWVATLGGDWFIDNNKLLTQIAATFGTLGLSTLTGCTETPTLSEAPDPYIDPTETDEYDAGTTSTATALRGCLYLIADEENSERFYLSDDMENIISTFTGDLFDKFTTDPHPTQPPLPNLVSGNFDMTGFIFLDDVDGYEGLPDSNRKNSVGQFAFGNRLHEFENQSHERWEFPYMTCHADSSVNPPEFEVATQIDTVSFSYRESSPSDNEEWTGFYRSITIYLYTYDTGDQDIRIFYNDNPGPVTTEISNVSSSDSDVDPVDFALAADKIDDLVQDQFDIWSDMLRGERAAFRYFPAPEE